MRQVKNKDSEIEVKLRKELWSRGLRYQKNVTGIVGKPDIVFKGKKVAVFCDSEFFHGKDWEVLKPRLEKGNNSEYWVKKISRNIERDKEKDQALLFLGWTIIHFWGKEILNNVELKKIQLFLNLFLVLFISFSNSNCTN